MLGSKVVHFKVIGCVGIEVISKALVSTRFDSEKFHVFMGVLESGFVLVYDWVA